MRQRPYVAAPARPSISSRRTAAACRGRATSMEARPSRGTAAAPRRCRTRRTGTRRRAACRLAATSPVDRRGRGPRGGSGSRLQVKISTTRSNARLPLRRQRRAGRRRGSPDARPAEFGPRATLDRGRRDVEGAWWRSRARRGTPRRRRAPQPTTTARRPARRGRSRSAQVAQVHLRHGAVPRHADRRRPAPRRTARRTRPSVTAPDRVGRQLVGAHVPVTRRAHALDPAARARRTRT